MRGITKLLLTMIVIGSALIIGLITIDKQLLASEVSSSIIQSEVVDSEIGTNNEVESSNQSEIASSRDEEQVVDLTGMTQEQVAAALDPDQKSQNFIILNPDQFASRRGYKVTEIIADENFSNVNSTMYGEYGVYKVNGHFVFCIEPGYDTLNSAQKVEESGSVYGQFKDSSQTYISRVISSSIGNYRRTDNNDFIFAGQLLIWDYVSAHEADVIGNPMADWNPDYLTSWTIHNSTYINQIQIIESELEEWTTLPSFLGNSPANAKKHTLKYNKANDNFTITLKDSNKVWDSKYAWYGTIGDFKFTNPTGSDNLKITTSDVHSDYSPARKFVWNPPISGKRELYDAGQDLIYVGASPQIGYLKMKTAKLPNGGFELTKKGKTRSGGEKALAGVKFKVTSDRGFEHVYTTDQKGVIKTKKNLKPGQYHISEISAPSDYNVGYEHDLTIRPDQITAINNGRPIINDLYYNKIKLKKVGQNFENSDTSLVPIKGVSFELYKEVGEPNEVIDGKDKLVDTLVSNRDGIVESGKLYQGDYVIKEKQAAPGYLKNNQQYPFAISNNGKISSGAKLDLGKVENKVIKGKVELHKVGAGECKLNKQCTTPLANVEFEIYDDANNNQLLDDEEKQPVETITTDEDGYAISGNLKYGHYLIKESATNDANYRLDDSLYDFVIEQPNTVVSINEGQPIVNERYYNRVKFEKVGQSLDNGDDSLYPLSDVSFELYQEVGEANQVVDGRDKKIDSLVSNQAGIVESGKLYPGNYVIRESEAAPGYVISEEQYPFVITNDEAESDGQVIELGTLENDVISGRVELSKVGVGSCKKSSECTIPLDNVEFEIYSDSNNNFELDKDEQVAIDTVVTDADGYGLSNKLKYGHYFVRESANQHPNYEINDTVYDFTIDSPNQVVSLNDGEPIVNEEKTGKVELFKQGETLTNGDGTIQFLNGAEYQIIDSNDQVVETLVTNKSGYAVSDELSFGKYSLVESQPPTGYVLDPTVYNFEINNKTYDQNISFELSDKVIRNKIVIDKIDSANGEELPGAELEVTDRNSKQVVEKWTSTEEPHSFEVNYGNYQICETTAPAGYKQLTECTNFDVTKDGVKQSFTLVNQRMKIAITGATSKRTWIIVLLIMIIILLGCLYARIYINKI